MAAREKSRAFFVSFCGSHSLRKFDMLASSETGRREARRWQSR